MDSVDDDFLAGDHDDADGGNAVLDSDGFDRWSG